MKNSSLQTFQGGWNQLQHAIFTNNVASGFNATSFWISSKGDRLYEITGTTVTQYNLLGPIWDIGENKLATQNIGPSVGTFSVSSEDSTPTGLFFNTDETKMYVIGQNTKTIYEYTLDTPGDITSITACLSIFFIFFPMSYFIFL